jgi:hypothetical protein
LGRAAAALYVTQQPATLGYGIFCCAYAAHAQQKTLPRRIRRKPGQGKYYWALQIKIITA